MDIIGQKLSVRVVGRQTVVQQAASKRWTKLETIRSWKRCFCVVRESFFPGLQRFSECQHQYCYYWVTALKRWNDYLLGVSMLTSSCNRDQIEMLICRCQTLERPNFARGFDNDTSV